MQDFGLVFEPHKMLLPFAYVLGGKVFDSTLKVVFNKYEDDSILITDIKGVDSKTNLLHDMNFLTQIGDELEGTIYDLVGGNEVYWDEINSPWW